MPHHDPPWRQAGGWWVAPPLIATLVALAGLAGALTPS